MRPAYDRCQINPDYQYVSHAAFERYQQLCRPAASAGRAQPPCPGLQRGAGLALARSTEPQKIWRGEKKTQTSRSVD